MPAHHAAADDGVRVRDPRDEDALHLAARSAAGSARRSSSTPSTCSWRRSPRRSGRPVKWVESRRENYVATTHGRDHVTYLEVGAKRDGTITALDGEDVREPRRRSSRRSRPGIPTTLYGRMLSGALPHPGHPLPGARRLHEHRHGRRLSRRRPAGGDLRRRAGGRPRRARARPRPGRGAAEQLHPAGRVPVRPGHPRRHEVRHRRLREGARRVRSRSSATTTSGASRRPRAAEGRYLGIGFSTYVEICGVAPSAWIGAGGQGWGAATVGERERARPPDRQGRRHDRLDSAGPGARDDGRAGGRRRARRAGRGRHGRARRHARHAVRLRHVRQPQRGGRRGRRLPRAAADQARRRSAIAAHMLEAIPRTSSYEGGRAFVKGSPATGEDDPGDRRRRRARLRPPGGRGAVPRRHVLLRPAELHVPVRHARRRRRGRRRDRRGEAAALRRRRRRRQGDQPDDRRRPGAGRHRAGRRAGALGGGGLRRGRPAADVEPDGLRGPEGRLPPDARGRADGDADGREPARRQGRGRDGHDRLDARRS